MIFLKIRVTKYKYQRLPYVLVTNTTVMSAENEPDLSCKPEKLEEGVCILPLEKYSVVEVITGNILEASSEDSGLKF